MATPVSSLVGGGVKRVFRGKYNGSERNGGIITLPEVDTNKTVVNMLSSAYYGAKRTSDSSSEFGGWADAIYCELVDSTTLKIVNRVDMYMGGSSMPIWDRYVPVSWEVIEYV
ncbi:hypothetical protein B1L02_11860 [Pseudoalteromonas piscicida]|uniref:Uncharacterized protein n=1 Tax=Pseudoalteromonas piscicida TaxID=43662 RepID=A0AAD0W329_PSEO7|nr:hypothetical protein B1L02_11860 [Pseudoalteromonas piscicida]AXR01654.1 hypothetical protein D0511_05885 [Pseudoalteromonas piscicida]